MRRTFEAKPTEFSINLAHFGHASGPVQVSEQKAKEEKEGEDAEESDKQEQSELVETIHVRNLLHRQQDSEKECDRVEVVTHAD